MAESQYAQIKVNALETAQAIRKGQAVSNVDAHRIEVVVQALEEVEREKAKTNAGFIQIRDAVRELKNAYEE